MQTMPTPTTPTTNDDHIGSLFSSQMSQKVNNNNSLPGWFNLNRHKRQRPMTYNHELFYRQWSRFLSFNAYNNVQIKRYILCTE